MTTTTQLILDICQFKHDKIRAVNLDELSENPDKNNVIIDFARNPLRVVSSNKNDNLSNTLAHQLAANGFFKELKELITSNRVYFSK